MRIEILVDGSEEPLIHPINKQKLVLGSGETCDIIIPSEQISRKHLIIVAEGDSYFVIDQGSTNGSFINEERLVPGRRTEFTSFFPVRLGEHVLITLLSDQDLTEEKDDGPLIPVPKEPAPLQSRGSAESTKMISLADLKKAKTSDLQARRQEVIKKKTTSAKAPPKKTKRKKENERFKTLLWLMIFALAGIGYYTVKNKEEEKPVARVGEIVRVDPKAVAKTEQAKPAEESQLIPQEDLVPKEKFIQFLGDAKCLTDIEKYFCEKIPGANGRFGVVQVGTSVNIMLDGSAFINEARGIVVRPPVDATGQVPPDLEETYRKTLMNTAMALFFLKTFPADIDWEKIKDMKMFIALYEMAGEQPFVQVVAAAYPERIKALKPIMLPLHINNVKQIGANAIKYLEKYYTTY